MKNLGFRCGIEIHQQLGTDKLFCRCPSESRIPASVFFERSLRMSVGETGRVDIAAQYEMAKKRIFRYEGSIDSVCLVEMDEEPPDKMNPDALKVALQVARMLDMEIVDEIRVMRKIVVDGSNVSGFQRTALVASGGNIDTSLGPVGISSLCIEEEACQIIGQNGNKVAYNLNRLGIPLLEIATDASIQNAEHCREVAEKIGMVLRSTGKVKRGIGTIRQDINVSIAKGNRVEIKGAQDLAMIPALVENEVKRQESLISLELPKKSGKIIDVSKVLAKTGCSLIFNALKNGGAVLGVCLPGAKGVLGAELVPGRRLGTELSDYAKTVESIKGLIHSDENLQKYSFADSEIELLRKKLECKSKDAFVLIFGTADKAKTALLRVQERLSLPNAPKEVRRALPDGTTSFMRPMPGASRMYPETDVPSEVVDYSVLESIEMPELLDAKIGRLEKETGLGKDVLKRIFKQGRDGVLHTVLDETSLKAQFVADVLLSAEKEIRKFAGKEIIPEDEDYILVFRSLDTGKIAKESAYSILSEADVAEAIEKNALISDKVLRAELKKIIEKNRGAPFGALMGEAMKRLRGKASGEKISAFLKELS